MNRIIQDETAFLRAPIIDTSAELEITDIKNISAVAAKLKKLYGDITVVADGAHVAISALKSAKTIAVAAQTDFDKKRYNAADAMRVIARLTLDEGGCPWDKAQTHESIRINMIEEAYEAVDAIDKRDVENMREEFGDVFLQSILQSDIARRAGEFDFDDVCDELCKKLIGRHTFIFGADSATNPDEALTLWEKAKGVEKHYDTVKNQLERLPDNFPSLLLCQKTARRRPRRRTCNRLSPRATIRALSRRAPHCCRTMARTRKSSLTRLSSAKLRSYDRERVLYR